MLHSNGLHQDLAIEDCGPRASPQSPRSSNHENGSEAKNSRDLRFRSTGLSRSQHTRGAARLQSYTRAISKAPKISTRGRGIVEALGHLLNRGLYLNLSCGSWTRPEAIKFYVYELIMVKTKVKGSPNRTSPTRKGGPVQPRPAKMPRNGRVRWEDTS